MMDLIKKLRPEYISLLIYLQAVKYKDIKEVKINGKIYNLENKEDRDKLEEYLVNELLKLFLWLMNKDEKK